MTDLRDKVARAMFETTSYASIRWDTVVREGGSLLDQFRQAADAILALPEIADALAHHAQQQQWMRDALGGLAISRMKADGTVERIDPADFRPDPPTA